jgi:hypothetical protein
MRRLALIMILLVPALAYAAPSIRFAEDSYDFGKVREGEKVEHTFEFNNAGTEELRIERVSTT